MKRWFREGVTLLVVRDTSPTTTSLRIPLVLFHFLVGMTVFWIVGAGLLAIWTTDIALRLQAQEVVVAENRRLREELSKIDLLAEELNRIVERERRILLAAQAFLDDSESTSPAMATETPEFRGYTRELQSAVIRDLAEITELRARREPLFERARRRLFDPTPFPSWRILALDANPSQSTRPASQGLAPHHLPPGSPVRAPTPGVVIKTEWDVDLGLSLTLGHADGTTTRLAGLGEIHVEPGDLVGEGDLLGRSPRAVSQHVRPVWTGRFIGGVAIPAW